MAEEMSEKQREARDALTEEQREVFDVFVKDYKFACQVNYGKSFVS